MQTELTEALGNWLQHFSWDWFGTFTFDQPISDRGVSYKMKNYLDRLGSHSLTSPYMAWVPEHKTGGQPHVHALIGGVDLLARKCSGTPCRGCGVHLWRSGFANIRRYDINKGAAFYILKDVGSGKSELEIEGEESSWRLADLPTSPLVN